jgi:hypothetical protein
MGHDRTQQVVELCLGIAIEQPGSELAGFGFARRLVFVFVVETSCFEGWQESSLPHATRWAL